MATGDNKNLDKLMNKMNAETGRSDAEEILRLQATRQLKNEHKKISQMTDLEKQLYAEMEQKTIEEYEEEFISDKPIVYNGEHKPFYSPIASIVLDAFFTDGKN
ncbi:MAG: hypothetical protein E7565_03850 [Ruminococcaceae bacterium]|nr:hypothetical protein [Oscillospiraceae bacterium]